MPRLSKQAPLAFLLNDPWAIKLANIWTNHVEHWNCGLSYQEKILKMLVEGKRSENVETRELEGIIP